MSKYQKLLNKETKISLEKLEDLEPDSLEDAFESISYERERKSKRLYNDLQNHLIAYETLSQQQEIVYSLLKEAQPITNSHLMTIEASVESILKIANIDYKVNSIPTIENASNDFSKGILQTEVSLEFIGSIIKGIITGIDKALRAIEEWIAEGILRVVRLFRASKDSFIKLKLKLMERDRGFGGQNRTNANLAIKLQINGKVLDFNGLMKQLQLENKILTESFNRINSTFKAEAIKNQCDALIYKVIDKKINASVFTEKIFEAFSKSLALDFKLSEKDDKGPVFRSQEFLGGQFIKVVGRSFGLPNIFGSKIKGELKGLQQPVLIPKKIKEDTSRDEEIKLLSSKEAIQLIDQCLENLLLVEQIEKIAFKFEGVIKEAKKRLAYDIQEDQFDHIGEKLKSILKLDFDEKHLAKFARARQLVINNCIYLVPDTFIYSCEMAYASCKAVKELCSLSA